MSRSTRPRARLRARRATAAAAALVALAALTGFGSAASASTVHLTAASRTAAKIAPAVRDSDHGEVPEAGVCATCKPPLVYPTASGPVMGASTGTITLTPIYWTPAGYSFTAADPTYMTLINKYLSDIAAASSATGNVYAILPEYYQVANGVTTNIKYKFVAGTPMTDTDAFPATGQCTNTAPPAGLGIVYSACITDAQTQAELKAYTAANSLPNDLNHLYLLFFPPNAQTQLGTTNFSLTQFAGYHSHTGTLIYTNEPFDPGFAVSAPNDDPSADSAINTISHEVSEAVTDPNGGSGWGDTANPGNEIGDECAGNYGTQLGTVNTPDYGAMPYNQVINGDKYYTQTEFSNAAYKATGIGTGCRQTAYGSGGNVPRKSRHDTAGVTSTVTVDTSPATLPADGTSTTTITATATDSNGDPVAGDPIVLAARDDIETPGSCGTLSTGYGPAAAQVTNAAGQVTATYTAGTSAADCYITATDTTSGTTNQTIIYQGGDASTAPAVTQTAPASTLTSGGDTTTFSVSAMNPSADTIADARFDLYLTGDGNGATGIDASQLTLSYKDPSTGGKFVNIPLTGSTANGGVIDGFILPDTAQSLDVGATKTADFQLTLAGNAADTATTGAPLQVETDLDQFDPADGSQSNLLKGTPASINVVQAAGDTITYSGKLVTTLAPNGSTPGQATLVAKTCTFASDGAACRLTGTETFTAAGGTLTGTITTEPKPGRPDQTITYTETFTNSSPTQGSGTGTAQVIDFDNGNSFTANLADAYNTIPDPTAPNVQKYEGTLILTNPTP